MKYFSSPITIVVILFCYAGIDVNNIFPSQSTFIDYVTYICRGIVTALGFIGFLAIQNSKNIQNKNLLLYGILIVYFALILFSSILNGNLTLDILLKNTFALGLYYYFVFCSYNINNLLKSTYIFFFCILLLNYFFYFFIPNIGVYALDQNGMPLLKGILTNRNGVALYVIPLVVLGHILGENKESRFPYKLISLFGLICIFLTGSDTGLVVILFLFLSLFLMKVKMLPFFVLYFTVFLSLTMLNFGNNRYLSYIIGDLLGSDLTLSGRTEIWNISLQLIPSSLIFGFGVGSNKIAEALGFQTATNGNPLNDPFNGILNILFFNGVLGLLFFIAIMALILFRLNNSQKIKKENYYLIIFFMSFSIVAISESMFQFTHILFWIFIVISFSYSRSLNET